MPVEQTQLRAHESEPDKLRLSEFTVGHGADSLRVLAEELEVEFLDDLAIHEASVEYIERIPIGFARQHCVLGLASDESVLTVAIGQVEKWGQLDILGRFLGRTIEPIFCPPEKILVAINRAYQQRSGQTQTLIDSLDGTKVLEELAGLDSREDLLDVADRAPVIKLANLILFEAVKNRASDVHIQPYEERLVIRQRIDGVLFDSFDVPKQFQDELISRIKVIGQMNIAEKRLPQDGRATVGVGDRMVDLRIASIPTSHGERVVIRLLDKSAKLYSLVELGMEKRILEQFGQLIHLEHGLILVTGPTGSGKSTTLYGGLQEINSTDRNVVTLEDPIEYQIDGISQTQVNEKKGMTFASGLRNVLRQDPDIIMVGEIRDKETAAMAIQSALTGHLVFSTLHTNDAASAVTRLLDLGIEPYLVASSTIAVLAQRLIRKNCTKCSKSVTLSEHEKNQLGLTDQQLRGSNIQKGNGCEACRKTGYNGRIGIFELLIVDDAVRTKIQSRANASEIRDSAVAGGMSLLRDDAIDKVLSGATTLDEIVRVTMRSTL